MPELTLALGVCFGGLIVGAVTDYATGRLPNWLTFSMMALGIAIWTTQSDPLFALKGIGFAFAIHFPLFALNVVRAGDAKLVMGAGALIGWVETFDLTIWYAVIYIPVGLGMLALKGRLGNLVKVAEKMASKEDDSEEEQETELTQLRTGPVIAAAGFAAAFTDILNFA